MKKELIELKVLEAYTRDVTRGVARIDYDSMETIGALTGDVIELKGIKSIVAKILPLYPSDEGKGIVRIDGLARDSSEAGIGDRLKIRKIKAVVAMKVIVTPLEVMPQINPRYLADALESMPLIKDTKFLVPYYGGALKFGVSEVFPQGVVIVTLNTQFEIKEIPKKEEKELKVDFDKLLKELKKAKPKIKEKKLSKLQLEQSEKFINRRIFSILQDIREAEAEPDLGNREKKLKTIWDDFLALIEKASKTFPNNDFIPKKIKSFDDLKTFSGVVGIGQYMKSSIRTTADALGVKHLEIGTTEKIIGNDVFIVHGHDEEAKEKVARFIERAELKSVILHEQPNSGKTLIEKFEINTSKIGYAVIILTPDDICISKNSDGKEIKENRARQNVVLELGFFIGAIGRDRTCILYKKGVSIPTDYQGVVYVKMDDSDSWKLELAREIKKAGIPVDMNKIF